MLTGVVHMEFTSWGKIPRLHQIWEITEKIDGTNAVLYWADQHDGREHDSFALDNVEGLYLYAGSRKRWLNPTSDNFGFAAWAQANAKQLSVLGPGRHHGEWLGQGIQRGYGLSHKMFVLFNPKWADQHGAGLPEAVTHLPVLDQVVGERINEGVAASLEWLRMHGSALVPGYRRPEGIVLRHMQSNTRFKVLLEGDEIPKSKAPQWADEIAQFKVDPFSDLADAFKQAAADKLRMVAAHV